MLLYRTCFFIELVWCNWCFRSS